MPLNGINTPAPLAVVAAVFEANQNSPALLELVDDSICSKELLKRRSASQATMEFLDAHPVIRPMAEYREFLRNVLQGD